MVFQDPMTSLNPGQADRRRSSPRPCATTSSMTRDEADERAVGLLRAGAHPLARAPDAAVPARAVGRHATARRDRDGARLRAAAADRRRAHDGARRHRPEGDPRPARRPARRPQHVDDPHHPRSGCRRGTRRPDRRDVRRAAHGARHRQGPVRRHATPLHRGAARARSRAPTCRATRDCTRSRGARPICSTRRRAARSRRAVDTPNPSASTSSHRSVESGGDHWFACHFTRRHVDGRAALAANETAGVTAAGLPLDEAAEEFV